MGKRFLIFVIDDSVSASATPEEDEAIDVFNDQLRENGQLITMGGLLSPASASVIDNREGRSTETGKPYLMHERIFLDFG